MSESPSHFPGTAAAAPVSISSDGLLPQLVQHLRQNRTVLREEWARRIDLSKMHAVGDLQGGIEEAERLLGYEVTRTGEQTG